MCNLCFVPSLPISPRSLIVYSVHYFLIIILHIIGRFVLGSQNFMFAVIRIEFNSIFIFLYLALLCSCALHLLRHFIGGTDEETKKCDPIDKIALK